MTTRYRCTHQQPKRPSLDSQLVHPINISAPLAHLSDFPYIESSIERDTQSYPILSHDSFFSSQKLNHFLNLCTFKRLAVFRSKNRCHGNDGSHVVFSTSLLSCVVIAKSSANFKSSQSLFPCRSQLVS